MNSTTAIAEAVSVFHDNVYTSALDFGMAPDEAYDAAFVDDLDAIAEIERQEFYGDDIDLSDDFDTLPQDTLL